MAVQAQHPSNILLLNRSVQEGKNNDYLLQPQPGGSSGGVGGGSGGFLDQSHMLFNNGGTNSRNRGREMVTTTTTMNPLMSMHLQPQPLQLIDLTQLHTHTHHHHQPNVVSTGLGLAFGEQNHSQLQHQPQQSTQQNQTNYPQQQQTLSSQSSQSSVLLSLLSEDLASQIKQQTDEIEHFLHLQAEHLRRTLAEKRQRHYRALIGAAEESMSRKLREKEAEVQKAAGRTAELEARAAQLSAEAQVWQARARAQEATAATLQAQLQQAMIGGGCAQQDRVDGELGSGGGDAEDAESAYVDPERVEVANGPSCKACRRRVASVVLLPCRHLCVCTECEAAVQACPICLTFRTSSVEVFLC